MNLKQMIINDLDNFYNVNDFGISASFNSLPIVVYFLDDIEISSSKESVISAKVSDTTGIAVGSAIVVDGVNYEVSNFDFINSEKIERIISIEKV